MGAREEKEWERGERGEKARLHAAGAADADVRDVAVAADLVAGVDNHHAPLALRVGAARHSSHNTAGSE